MSLDSLKALCMCESQQGAVLDGLPALATRPCKVL